VHTFSHLSASIVLSRKRASEGLFPAIDPLQSSSKMATPGIVGERHYALAQEIRRTLAQYAELKDIIAMLGLEQLSPEDRKVVGRARRLERFLTQPFFTTEQFTGLKGKLVSLKDSLDGCERILHDEFQDYPERALYMIGAISEAKGRPKPVPPAGPAKPDSKPEAKAEPKPAANHEVKPDTAAGPKPKSGSEAKPKAGPKPAAESPANATPEPPPPAAKPQPEAKPAAAMHDA
jgi:F-type H+-transporting ATPase subunit beta